VRDYRRRFRQDPANLTVLQFGGEVGDDPTRALLVASNDTGHLGGPTPLRDGG